jgi:hypothetical protein
MFLVVEMYKFKGGIKDRLGTLSLPKFDIE